MHNLDLLEWFRAHKRDLPWRLNRDPYRIWISETMLQQTTTTAVIPYFQRFLKEFPTLTDLAGADESRVLEAWAGLGYYSRARNLHKAAKALNDRPTFPRSHEELLELPGFGPYTARAVASLAFGAPVGVVDGNVIRVLSRYHGEKWEWWRPAVRGHIQALADKWCAELPSGEVNQALMELGRLICTPQSPKCPLCPMRAGCRALKTNSTTQLPLSKPRRAKELWCWRPEIHLSGGRVAITRNTGLPFLKGQWILPGEGAELKNSPKRFDYRHCITHHDIFVTLNSKPPRLKKRDWMWVPLEEIQRHVPSSLVVKALRVSGALGDSRGMRHGRRQVGASRDVLRHR